LSGQGTSDQSAAETFEEVAREIKAGRGGRRIVAELVRQRWTKEAATEFVSLVARSVDDQRSSRQGRAEQAQSAQRRMQTGAVWVIGGAVATFALMWWVDSPLYIVGIAAVLYGLMDVFSGASIWLKNRDVSAPGTTPPKPGPAAPKKANAR
jgi:hypothetical protein